jgi:hypothetical protein
MPRTVRRRSQEARSQAPEANGKLARRIVQDEAMIWWRPAQTMRGKLCKGLIDRDLLTVKDIVTRTTTRAPSRPNGSSTASWCGVTSPFRSFAARRSPASKRRWHSGEHPSDLRHVPRRSAQRHPRLRSAGRQRHQDRHHQGRVQGGAVPRFGDDQPLDDGLFHRPLASLPAPATTRQGGATVTNATAPANTGGTGIVAFWTPSASLSWAA